MVVKNRVTPKWLAPVSGNIADWWFNVDPYPGFPELVAPSRPVP